MINNDLAEMIRKSGGVSELSMALAHSYESNASRFSNPLNPTRKMFANTGTVRVNWEASANQVLGETEVLAAYEDASDEEGPERIFIKFADGSSLNGFDKLKIKTVVEVDDIGGRNPNRNQMRSALTTYLADLMTPDFEGKRVIDQNGMCVKS